MEQNRFTMLDVKRSKKELGNYHPKRILENINHLVAVNVFALRDAESLTDSNIDIHCLSREFRQVFKEKNDKRVYALLDKCRYTKPELIDKLFEKHHAYEFSFEKKTKDLFGVYMGALGWNGYALTDPIKQAGQQEGSMLSYLKKIVHEHQTFQVNDPMPKFCYWGNYITCGHDEGSTKKHPRLYLSFADMLGKFPLFHYITIDDGLFYQIPLSSKIVNNGKSLALTIHEPFDPNFYFEVTLPVENNLTHSTQFVYKSNTETEPSRMFICASKLERIYRTGTVDTKTIQTFIGRNLTPQQATQRLTTFFGTRRAKQIVTQTLKLRLMEFI